VTMIKLGIALFWAAVVAFVTSLFWISLFYSMIGEADYRASRAESQQARAQLLKIPAIYKAHKYVEECKLGNDSILCTVRRKGIQSQETYK
jgi:hypothetical protein